MLEFTQMRSFKFVCIHWQRCQLTKQSIKTNFVTIATKTQQPRFPKGTECTMNFQIFNIQEDIRWFKFLCPQGTRRPQLNASKTFQFVINLPFLSRESNNCLKVYFVLLNLKKNRFQISREGVTHCSTPLNKSKGVYLLCDWLWGRG